MNAMATGGGRVDFKDVLLAILYRRAKERGEVSPDLEARVNRRGRSRIEFICSILPDQGRPAPKTRACAGRRTDARIR